MTLVLIFAAILFIGLIILDIILFGRRGRELDRRLEAAGGLRQMYASFIETLLSKSKSVLLNNTPSLIIIVGQYDKLNYKWKIRTPDGKNLIVRMTVKRDDEVIEQKNFKFPISAECDSENILRVIYQHVEHKEIIENCVSDKKNSNVHPEIKEEVPSPINNDCCGERQNGEKIIRKDLRSRLDKLVTGIEGDCINKGYSGLRVQDAIQEGIIKFFDTINIEEAKSVLRELGSEIDDVDELFDEERERAINLYLPGYHVEDNALMYQLRISFREEIEKRINGFIADCPYKDDDKFMTGMMVKINLLKYLETLMAQKEGFQQVLDCIGSDIDAEIFLKTERDIAIKKYIKL